MPTYTYTLCTPDAASPMNQTQPLILENFQAINEFVDVNHVGFNSDDFGKHNQTLMPFVSDLPNSKINAINVFTQETPDGDNAAEIFMQYPTGRIRQLSGGSSFDNTTTVTYGTGWIKFPSGIICKYGSYTFGSTGSDASYYFPVSDDIPVFQSRVVYGKITPLVNPTRSDTPNNAWAFNPCPTFFTTSIFGYSTGNDDLTVNYFCIGI